MPCGTHSTKRDIVCETDLQNSTFTDYMVSFTSIMSPFLQTKCNYGVNPVFMNSFPQGM